MGLDFPMTGLRQEKAYIMGLLVRRQGVWVLEAIEILSEKNATFTEGRVWVQLYPFAFLATRYAEARKKAEPMLAKLRERFGLVEEMM